MPAAARVNAPEQIEATRAPRLKLEFDVVVDGDRFSGHSRAGRLPRSAVAGAARSAASWAHLIGAVVGLDALPDPAEAPGIGHRLLGGTQRPPPFGGRGGGG